MKYKVGDKVRIVDNIAKVKCNGHSYNREMLKLQGKVLSITEVGRNFYKLNGNRCFWSEAMVTSSKKGSSTDD